MWDVLVCEDFTDLREALVDFLHDSGHWRVRAVSDGQGVRLALAEHVPDVMLLDVGLPQESGTEVARWVKAAHPGLGIVMLSGRSSPADRLAGWRCGADVYLLKPAEMEEVELALTALVKRGQPLAAGSVPAAPLPVLQVARGQLICPGGEPCQLTAREAMLLHALALSHGTVVESETLRRLLWSDLEEDIDHNNALFSLVRRLRRKLDGMGFPADALNAVRGRGYRLACPLRFE
jgi:DNA-binding response OmpR family regulator